MSCWKPLGSNSGSWNPQLVVKCYERCILISLIMKANRYHKLFSVSLKQSQNIIQINIIAFQKFPGKDHIIRATYVQCNPVIDTHQYIHIHRYNRITSICNLNYDMTMIAEYYYSKHSFVQHTDQICHWERPERSGELWIVIKKCFDFIRQV